jgi:hypothetical protein
VRAGELTELEDSLHELINEAGHEPLLASVAWCRALPLRLLDPTAFGLNQPNIVDTIELNKTATLLDVPVEDNG